MCIRDSYYTDEQVAARERQERADAEAEATRRRQTEQQAEANRLAQARLDAEQRNTETDNTRAQAQLELQQAADARAAAAANRPSLVNAPSTKRTITQFNPATGAYEAVDNPGFDPAEKAAADAKAQAQAMRDRLGLAIEAGKLTEASASAQYERWFKENVTVPMQRAQEAR